MKKIQLSPDATSGGTPSKDTQQQIIDRLTAENEQLTAENSEFKAENKTLKAELAKYKSAEAQDAADEKLIIEKMTHGLSRPQALNVIQRQRNFEAAKEKSKAQRPKHKVQSQVTPTTNNTKVSIVPIIPMKKIKLQFAALLGTFAARIERHFSSTDPSPVPLANSLALSSDSGIQTLQIDPAATLPIASKYLIYERGSAYNYARIAGGVNVPLGVSSDAPFALGDFLNIRRLGAKKGFEIGIPAGAIATDHLVAVDPAGTGKIVDLTTQGNGTYWVVGRATVAVSATDIEVSYVPDVPYQVNNNNGTWTYIGANV